MLFVSCWMPPHQQRRKFPGIIYYYDLGCASSMGNVEFANPRDDTTIFVLRTKDARKPRRERTKHVIHPTNRLFMGLIRYFLTLNLGIASYTHAPSLTLLCHFSCHMQGGNELRSGRPAVYSFNTLLLFLLTTTQKQTDGRSWRKSFFLWTVRRDYTHGARGDYLLMLWARGGLIKNPGYGTFVIVENTNTDIPGTVSTTVWIRIIRFLGIKGRIPFCLYIS